MDALVLIGIGIGLLVAAYRPRDRRPPVVGSSIRLSPDSEAGFCPEPRS